MYVADNISGIKKIIFCLFILMADKNDIKKNKSNTRCQCLYQTTDEDE